MANSAHREWLCGVCQVLGVAALTAGMILSWAPSARAQTYRLRVLHKFSGNDGAFPLYGSLLRDASGNLYGTTESGGSSNDGIVFKLDSSGKLTVLYSFTGAMDGEFPEAGLVRDKEGNLYGTTYEGGGNTCPGNRSCGVVFSMDKNGNEIVLHRFTGTNGDGANPQTGLTRDAKGNLYGVTQYGGTVDCDGTLGCGTVFKLDSAGNETVVYNFTGGSGTFPLSTLIRDSAGNLYGTTYEGGTFNVGTVYKVDSTGKEAVLYSFSPYEGGGTYPVGGLLRDAYGNLYGTTSAGGGSGYGTVFRLSAAGKETVLHSFAGPPGGATPWCSLVRDAEGNFYGTTSAGGPSGDGIVFKVTKSGKETMLYNFQGSDGAYPFPGLIRDKSGNLYGTTYLGGNTNCYPLGCGTVFELSPR
jgi:uncharacterized repeat protein (TIGR03803 family)